MFKSEFKSTELFTGSSCVFVFFHWDGNGVSQGKMKPKPCGQMTPINRSLNSTKKTFEKSVLWRQENLFLIKKKLKTTQKQLCNFAKLCGTISSAASTS